MMNDVAIKNIHNILETIISNGKNAIGIITMSPKGVIDLNWRTNDPKIAEEFQRALFAACKAGVEAVNSMPINKPQ